MITKTIRNKGLAFRLIISVFLATATVFIVIFLYNYLVTRKTVIENVQTQAEEITDKAVLNIDGILTAIRKVPDNYVHFIEAGEATDSGYMKLLLQMVNTNPELFGAAVAFIPEYRLKGRIYDGFYAFRDKGTTRVSTLGDEAYNYHLMDWFQVPLVTQKPYWTEPYFDEGGGDIVMATYAVPIFKEINGKKTAVGVLTADLSLTWLHDIMKKIKVYETGAGFIISRNGSVVTHPVTELIMNESIFSVAESMGIPAIREIGRKMIKGESGFITQPIPSSVNGKPSFLAFAPIPSNGWSVAVIFPVDEMMADVNKINRMIITLSVAGLLVLFFVIIVISRSVTGPLRRLTAAADYFAAGDFNVAVPVQNRMDEIGRLSASFRSMQNALSETIGSLKLATDNLKISNEKLEDANRTLERRVDERTAELVAKNHELDAALSNLRSAQAQLIQSEKLASLGQLTAGIAHEIKNPLNFVNNFAEVSIELIGEANEEFANIAPRVDSERVLMENIRMLILDIDGNLHKIAEHGKRADSIIRGMLLHSRGKAGEMQPTDINQLLDEYISLAYHGMRATDASFNIKIEKMYDQAPMKIDAVPQNLSRVFLNILNNAFYSTHAKKKELKDAYFPVLQVTTRMLDAEVEIVISDNGKGIPPAILEKIFNPFFTTKPAGSGTGLGLSISYDIIVAEHHGNLVADSLEGEYATFTLLLPIKQH